jgi:hypothetical protein
MSIDFILMSISIGYVVFLIQKTDFIYEYANLFLRLIKAKKLLIIMNIEGYEKTDLYKNFIEYLSGIYSGNKNVTGFIVRLSSCFICLSTVLNIFLFLFLNSLIFVFPGACVSVITFFVFDKITKSIYTTNI